MALSKKSLRVFGIALLLIVVLFLGLRFWVLDGVMAQTDQAYAERIHRLAKNSFSQDQIHLQSTLNDWAYWDDTYDYLSGDNPEYIDDNLNQPALSYIGINLMAFYDADGTPIFSIAYDHEKKVALHLKSSPDDWLTKYPSIGNILTDQGQVYGVIMLDEGPLMVAASPVLRSDYSGPPAGIIIFGTFINDRYIDILSDQMQAGIDFPALTLAQPPDLVTKIEANKRGEDFGVYTVRSGNTYQTYSVITDPDHQPALFFRTSTTGFFSERLKSATSIVFPVSIFLAMLIVGLAAYLHSRQVFQRLSWLRAVFASPMTPPAEKPNSAPDEFTEFAHKYIVSNIKYQEMSDDVDSFYDNYDHGCLVVDLTGFIHRANPAAAEILQVPAEQLVGRSLQEYVGDKDQLQALIHSWLNNKTSHLDLGITLPGSGSLLLAVTSISRQTANGECIGAFLLLQNITEQRRQSLALHESESTYKSLVDESSVGIFLIDTNGQIIEWNRRMVELFSLAKEQVLLKPVLPLFDETVVKNQAGKEFLNYMISAIGSVINGGSPNASTKVWGADIQPSKDGNPPPGDHHLPDSDRDGLPVGWHHYRYHRTETHGSG